MLFQAQYNVTSTCLITLHVAVAFYNQFFFQVIKCTLIITTTYCFLFIAGREYKIGKALKSKKKRSNHAVWLYAIQSLFCDRVYNLV